MHFGHNKDILEKGRFIDEYVQPKCSEDQEKRTNRRKHHLPLGFCSSEILTQFLYWKRMWKNHFTEKFYKPHKSNCDIQYLRCELLNDARIYHKFLWKVLLNLMLEFTTCNWHTYIPLENISFTQYFEDIVIKAIYLKRIRIYSESLWNFLYLCIIGF